MKKMKTERESSGDFLILFLIQMTMMITKQQKAMCYIFITSKAEKYNCLYQKQNGEVLKSQYQGELCTLNMFPNNKQNKLRQKEKDETKEEVI